MTSLWSCIGPPAFVRHVFQELVGGFSEGYILPSGNSDAVNMPDELLLD